MKRALGLLLVGGFAAVLSLYSASQAAGQPPELLRNYRFLPFHSTLHVSGGFAGLDINANIFGTYGLVTGFENGEDPPHPVGSLVPFAEFVEVRAKAINPADFGPYSYDLDATLNLSGLEGKPLPIFFPAILPNIEVFKFEGVEGQGAPLELYAVTVGRWMFMKGANRAPCCDFFDYEIKAVARQTPFVDFDSDGTNAAGDLANWESRFGDSAAGLSLLESGADLNGDGDIDGGDFLDWQRQREDAMPSIETFESILATALSATVAVPEPSSLCLAGLLLITMRYRRAV